MVAATLSPPYIALEQAMIDVFEVMREKQVQLCNFEIVTSGIFFGVCIVYAENADTDL